MAATLALLRSRLLLPPDAPEARAALDKAEAMRRQLLERVAIRHAAGWLDRQSQLGREVFARGGGANAATRSGRTTDITDLFRACLVALRVPDQVDADQLRFRHLWRVPDAITRITRMLDARPVGGALAQFLPEVAGAGEDKDLRCRAAVASTFSAGRRGRVPCALLCNPGRTRELHGQPREASRIERRHGQFTGRAAWISTASGTRVCAFPRSPSAPQPLAAATTSSRPGARLTPTVHRA